MKDAGHRPAVVVVAGATASGKTELAVQLAEELGGELIGADSVQVYDGFDIGSAKPTTEELRGVRHHLLSVLGPGDAIDAMQYAAMADSAIDEVARRGSLPIVVGGTGLWLRALLRGLVEAPPVDRELRARLEAEGESLGSAALHQRLAEVDPSTAAQVHENDLLRIVRALEVFEQTGEPLGELRAAHALGEPRYRAFFAVVSRDKDELAARIAARIDAMFSAGIVDEVRALRRRYPADARPFGSVGYRQVVEHLNGDVPLDETRFRADQATRKYARRQRTWFASEPGVSFRGTPDALRTGSGRDALDAFLAEHRR